MKIWTEYGSEHSMRLVLIGKFKQARDAEHIETLIEKIRKQAEEEQICSISYSPAQCQRFSEKMLSLLNDHNLHIFSPTDLEQFALDHSLDREGECITIRTNEVDVSAFIKIFVNAGAHVEVYSEHFYPEEQTDKN